MAERILDSATLSRRLVDPLGVVWRGVVPGRTFRVLVRRRTVQLFEVVHHLLMVLLLVLGGSLLVLIMKVREGVGCFQRLRGRVEVGFHVEVNSTNEPGRRTWAGIIDRPGDFFGLLEIAFGVEVITVNYKCELGRKMLAMDLTRTEGAGDTGLANWDSSTHFTLCGLCLGLEAERRRPPTLTAGR